MKIIIFLFTCLSLIIGGGSLEAHHSKKHHKHKHHHKKILFIKQMEFRKRSNRPIDHWSFENKTIRE